MSYSYDYSYEHSSSARDYVFEVLDGSLLIRTYERGCRHKLLHKFTYPSPELMFDMLDELNFGLRWPA